MSHVGLSVRSLRRRWKPHKERLQRASREHPTNIRFHRATSWLGRAEQADEAGDLEFSLLARWVAFNALYGQWDEQHRQPLPDDLCWHNFLGRLIALDTSGHLSSVLVEQQPLVMSILEDEYLSRFFWQAPSDVRARKSKKAMYDAQTWYVESNWLMLLDRLIERVYLLRCQLVHGAATYGGSLNRTALQNCAMMMAHLLPAVLLVWIDHGTREDWGPMCYPPYRDGRPSR